MYPLLLQFNVVAYNPLGRATLHYLHFPVHSTNFTVTDGTGRKIMSQAKTSYQQTTSLILVAMQVPTCTYARQRI